MHESLELERGHSNGLRAHHAHWPRGPDNKRGLAHSFFLEGWEVFDWRENVPPSGMIESTIAAPRSRSGRVRSSHHSVRNAPHHVGFPVDVGPLPKIDREGHRKPGIPVTRGVGVRAVGVLRQIGKMRAADSGSSKKKQASRLRSGESVSSQNRDAGHK